MEMNEEKCRSFPNLKLNSDTKTFNELFENWYTVVQKQLNNSSVSTTKQTPVNSVDFVNTPVRRNG